MKQIPQGLLWIVPIGLIAAALWRWEANGYGMFAWIASMFTINAIRAPYAK